MSWDGHIASMCAVGGADEACIVSITDGNKWAAKGAFNDMGPELALRFIKAARSQPLRDDEVLELDGVRYMVVSTDPDGVCRLVSKNLPEKQLMCVGLSKTAATFGCKKGEAQKNVVGIVENEAKFLRDQGY